MTYEEETTPGMYDEDRESVIEIETTIKVEGRTFTRGIAHSFESAEENFGKLQRAYESGAFKPNLEV